MMTSMEVFAAVAGGVICWIAFRGMRLEYLLIWYHMGRYRSEEAFLDLYDLADDSTTHKYVAETKSYADYLRGHQDARNEAHGKLVHYLDGIRAILLRVVLLVLAPAVIFWAGWYWYLLGVVVVLLALLTHRVGIKRHRIGYVQRTVIGSIMLAQWDSAKKKTRSGR